VRTWKSAVGALICCLGVLVLPVEAVALVPPTLGASGQALATDPVIAAEEDLVAVGGDLDPALGLVLAGAAILSAVWVQVHGSMGAPISATQAVMMGAQPDTAVLARYCAGQITGNSGYPSWDSAAFSQSGYQVDPSVFSTFVGELSDNAPFPVGPFDWPDGSGTVCDPMETFPLLYAGTTIAQEPWELEWCVQASVLDGGSSWAPSTVAGAVGTAWAWASQSALDFVNAACPAVWLETLPGYSADQVAGYAPTAPPVGTWTTSNSSCNMSVASGTFVNGGTTYYYEEAWLACMGPGFSTLTNESDFYFDEQPGDGLFGPAGLLQPAGPLFVGPGSSSGATYPPYTTSMPWGSDVVGQAQLWVGWWQTSGPVPDWSVATSVSVGGSGIGQGTAAVTAVATDSLPSQPGAAHAVSVTPTAGPQTSAPGSDVGSPTAPADSSGAPVPSPASVSNDTSFLGRLLTDLDVNSVSGFNAVVDSLGWLARTLLSPLNMIQSAVQGVGSLLYSLFVPSESPFAEVQGQLVGTPAYGWVSQVEGTTVGLESSVQGALSGSSNCGPELGFSGVAALSLVHDTSFDIRLPSWDSACPGNGPGGVSTSWDQEVGGVFGFRSELRTLLLLVVTLMFLVRVSRALPWQTSNPDDMAPGVEL